MYHCDRYEWLASLSKQHKMFLLLFFYHVYTHHVFTLCQCVLECYTTDTLSMQSVGNEHWILFLKVNWFHITKFVIENLDLWPNPITIHFWEFDNMIFPECWMSLLIVCLFILLISDVKITCKKKRNILCMS